MNEVEIAGLTKVFDPRQTIGPVTLDVRRGELLSLLGPSGCGKTTVLRMIAGFVTPTAGAIHLRGLDITHRPAHRRDVALVFQNFALFPHLDVFENVAFGLRRRGEAAQAVRTQVDQLVAIMKLEGLERRLPKALSGGQQQRVALARALAIKPTVILLDEPFSSLDTKLRESTRFELRALQRELGFTAILVTHDQGEALSISDHIAVMRNGRVEQFGTAQDIYYQPATPFIAEFVGRSNHVAGGIIRPESIRITAPGTPGSHLATVEAAAFLGSSCELVIRTQEGVSLTLIADGQASHRHPPGSAIRVAWPEEAIIKFGENA